MARLNLQTVKNLLTSVASQSAGNDVATKLNQADALAMQTAFTIPAAIVATNVSQTVDFGALRVGDLVAMIPATAGNADFIGPISTAGNLGQAAVVGNLYLVLRSVVTPLAQSVTNVKF